MSQGKMATWTAINFAALIALSLVAVAGVVLLAAGHVGVGVVLLVVATVAIVVKVSLIRLRLRASSRGLGR